MIPPQAHTSVAPQTISSPSEAVTNAPINVHVANAAAVVAAAPTGSVKPTIPTPQPQHVEMSPSGIPTTNDMIYDNGTAQNDDNSHIGATNAKDGELDDKGNRNTGNNRDSVKGSNYQFPNQHHQLLTGNRSDSRRHDDMNQTVVRNTHLSAISGGPTLTGGAGSGNGQSHGFPFNHQHNHASINTGQQQQATFHHAKYMLLHHQHNYSALESIEGAQAALTSAVIEMMFSGSNSRRKEGAIPTPAEFRAALNEVKEFARAKAKRQRDEARAERGKLQEAISVLVGTRPTSSGRNSTSKLNEKRHMSNGLALDMDESDDSVDDVNDDEEDAGCTNNEGNHGNVVGGGEGTTGTSSKEMAMRRGEWTQPH